MQLRDALLAHGPLDRDWVAQVRARWGGPLSRRAGRLAPQLPKSRCPSSIAPDGCSVAASLSTAAVLALADVRSRLARCPHTHKLHTRAAAHARARPAPPPPPPTALAPQVNRAEAEFWRRSAGFRVGYSDQILGFDCGGQQWVLEVGGRPPAAARAAGLMLPCAHRDTAGCRGKGQGAERRSIPCPTGACSVAPLHPGRPVQAQAQQMPCGRQR
jgi:hypothetical protein